MTWNNQTGYRLHIKSSDELTSISLTLERNEISDIIDELEQTLNGPAQRLERRALQNVTYSHTAGKATLEVKSHKFDLTLHFDNFDEVRLFLDYAKRVIHWSRDSSNLVPQTMLDYVNGSTKEEKTTEILEKINQQHGGNTLALASEEEIASYIREYWKERGMDPSRFYNYPNSIRDYLIGVEKTTYQALLDDSQIARINLLNQITNESREIALSEKRRRILYKELDELLDKRSIRLPTKLKELIYETVKTELDPDGIAEFEEVASRPYF